MPDASVEDFNAQMAKLDSMLKQAERLAHEGHLSNAAVLLQRAVSEAKEADDPATIARADEVRARIRNGLSDYDRRYFDASLSQRETQEDVGEEDVAEASLIGFALVMVGAVAMFIAAFLPYAESSSFGRVKDNTLIQNGNGWVFLALAVGAVVAALRAYRRGRGTPGPIILGVIGVGFAIYLGTNKNNLKLCPLGGNPLNLPCETASPGIGIYLAGIGALLTIAGGVELLRVRRAKGQKRSVDPRSREEVETKTCPECAESVKAAARVCRYCGYRFDSHRAEPV